MDWWVPCGYQRQFLLQYMRGGAFQMMALHIESTDRLNTMTIWLSRFPDNCLF
jgi:hypothetical protein